QAEDGIRDLIVTGVQTCALPISLSYQAWQQPLARPWDPTATNMHMIGVRQSLPFLGQRGLAGQAADLEAAASQSDVAARRLLVEDRKSVVEGKRVDRGGGRQIRR